MCSVRSPLNFVCTYCVLEMDVAFPIRYHHPVAEGHVPRSTLCERQRLACIRKSKWKAAATIIACDTMPAFFLSGPTLSRLLLPFCPAFVTGSPRLRTSGSGFEHHAQVYMT
jgi:hypothetical protein